MCKGGRLGGGDGNISDYGTNNHQRDWHGYGAVCDGQTLLFVAWACATQRHFGRQDIAVTDDESAQPSQSSLPTSGAAGCEISFLLWRILPRDAGTAWSHTSDYGPLP